VDPKLMTYVVMTALIAWVVYRRVRRNFGRQTIHEGWLWMRIGLLGVASALIVWVGVRNPTAIGAFLGGLACGTVLGVVGLRHTRFEFTPEGRFYTPHTYLGLAVTTLFVGRFIYRYIGMHHAAQSLGPNADPFGTLQRSPLTLATFGVLASYYLVFALGVLQKARAANAAAAPVSS
jgi:hypothetical protein